MGEWLAMGATWGGIVMVCWCPVVSPVDACCGIFFYEAGVMALAFGREEEI
jgi:hypothetical protein